MLGICAFAHELNASSPALDSGDEENHAPLSSGVGQLVHVGLGVGQPARPSLWHEQGNSSQRRRGHEELGLREPALDSYSPSQDNYTAAVGSEEVVTGEERQETKDFLDAIMATPCMKYAHQYLISMEAAPDSEEDFKVTHRCYWRVVWSWHIPRSPQTQLPRNRESMGGCLELHL